MRMVLVVFLLIAVSPAWAQSPEQASEKAYVAARVQAGAVLEEKSKSPDAFDTTTPGGRAWSAAYDQAKSHLEAELRRVLGPVPAPKGFSGGGTFSPEALCCGWAKACSTNIFRNDSGSVLVTTEGLLRLWLKEHKDWWKDNPLPTDPKAALQSSAFYTQAVSADAAVTIFAPLPIQAPAGASLAVAGLATQCNGSCSLPQHIAAAVVKGGRVYVALVDAALPAPTQGAAPPGGCDAVWKDFYDRYKAAYAAYEAEGTSRAGELLEVAGRIENKKRAAQPWTNAGRAAPRRRQGRCSLSGLTRQAQDLANSLAAG